MKVIVPINAPQRIIDIALNSAIKEQGGFNCYICNTPLAPKCCKLNCKEDHQVKILRIFNSLTGMLELNFLCVNCAVDLGAPI